MLTLFCAALFAQQQGVEIDSGVYLRDPASEAETALLFVRRERLEPPKSSPRRFPPNKTRWVFDWLTSGYGKPLGSPNQELRFRVYSQKRKPEADEAAGVGRMALRLWAMGHRKLNLDHPRMGRGLRTVDIYLCWGGEAGGEQRYEEDMEAGIARRVNVIYLYDLASFSNPLEMAREVAHEYGHAVLPAIGGFRSPEDWGNGYLGERLFLRWLRNAMREGSLGPEDAMGTTVDRLEAWVRAKVEPSESKIALEGPNVKTLAAGGQKAMDAYLGLALYAETLLPSAAFSRSLAIATKPSDFPAAIVEAASGHSYAVRVPSAVRGKAVWLPLGKGRLEGGKVMKRLAGWALVKPGSAAMIVHSKG